MLLRRAGEKELRSWFFPPAPKKIFSFCSWEFVSMQHVRTHFVPLSGRRRDRIMPIWLFMHKFGSFTSQNILACFIYFTRICSYTRAQSRAYFPSKSKEYIFRSPCCFSKLSSFNFRGASNIECFDGSNSALNVLKCCEKFDFKKLYNFWADFLL